MFTNLDPGFRKATINTLPTLSIGTIYKFIARVAKLENQLSLPVNSADQDDLMVDYVQVRQVLEICELRAFVFGPNAVRSACIGDALIRVAIKINTETEDITEFCCKQCPASEICMHLLAFTFWINRKTTDNEMPAVFDFWGDEVENLLDTVRMAPVHVSKIFRCDELNIEDANVNITPAEGSVFLENLLNEMQSLNLVNSNFYRHCRPVYDEFESIYIHHTLLESRNNGVTDCNTFFQYMKEQAKTGIYRRFMETSKDLYKSSIWLEMQYLRVRCSLIFQITSRKGPHDDALILESLFGKEREYNAAEKQRQKLHKRYILKQTEKLENTTYRDCGLLLNDNNPYLCAAPDGIAEDHIVEIKSPKNEKDFEKYLECRENIAPKYMAQIQIQMYMANVSKALYCVLSPNFDTSGALHYVWVQADMAYIANLLTVIEDFWREIVFPRLSKLYLFNL